MIRNRAKTALAMLSLFVSSASAVPGATGSSGRASPSLPQVPQIRLTPEGVSADEAAYLKTVAQEAEALAERAASAAGAARCDLLLTAAGHILAFQLAPGCTREILELSSVPADGARRQALDRARDLLGSAETAMDGLRDAPALPDGWLDRGRRHLDTLRAFSNALRVYLLPGDGLDPGRRAHEAVSQLSVLLEDPDERVVSAAALWQACLRRRISDPVRARRLLDAPLSDPPGGTMPFGFYTRLLRCRLYALSGGSAAALALLSQMEERCEDWLTGKQERADARRAITLVEIQVLRDWHETLSEPLGRDASQATGDAPEGTDPAGGEYAQATRAAARRWCADRIGQRIAERFAGDDPTVYRLSPAIPVLVRPTPSTGSTPSPPSHSKDVTDSINPPG